MKLLTVLQTLARIALPTFKRVCNFLSLELLYNI